MLNKNFNIILFMNKFSIPFPLISIQMYKYKNLFVTLKKKITFQLKSICIKLLLLQPWIGKITIFSWIFKTLLDGSKDFDWTRWLHFYFYFGVNTSQGLQSIEVFSFCYCDLKTSLLLFFKPLKANYGQSLKKHIHEHTNLRKFRYYYFLIWKV